MNSFTLFMGLALVTGWINFLTVWVARLLDVEGDYLRVSDINMLCVTVLVLECYFLRGRESTSIVNCIVIIGAALLSTFCAICAIRKKQNRKE